MMLLLAQQTVMGIEVTTLVGVGGALGALWAIYQKVNGIKRDLIKELKRELKLDNVEDEDEKQRVVGPQPFAVRSTIGLGNVDNTSDANKPISTATQTALNGKAASNATTTLAASGAATGSVILTLGASGTMALSLSSTQSESVLWTGTNNFQTLLINGVAAVSGTKGIQNGNIATYPVFPPPATYSPASVSGCKTWLEASTISGTSGANVSSWSDQSPSALTVTCTNAIYQKYGINGQPSVSFNGSNSYIQVASTFSGTAIAKSVAVFLVWQPVIQQNSGIVIGSGTGNVFWRGQEYNWNIQPINSNNYANSNGQFGKARVETFEYNGSTWNIYNNEQLVSTGSSTASMQIENTDLYIGRYSGGSYYRGLVAAVGVFSPPPNATDRRAIQQYLIDRYCATELPVVSLFGDSISIGWSGLGIPQLLNTYTGQNYRMQVNGVGGYTGTQTAANIVTAASNLDARKENIGVLWLPSNGIAAGVSGTTEYNTVMAAVDTYRAAGGKMLIIPMCPRNSGNASIEAERIIYNNLVKTNWRSRADGFIDPDEFPLLFAPSANDNATYFNGGLHPTTAGYALILPALGRAVDALAGLKRVPTTREQIVTAASGTFSVNFDLGAQATTSGSGNYAFQVMNAKSGLPLRIIHTNTGTTSGTITLPSNTKIAGGGTTVVVGGTSSMVMDIGVTGTNLLLTGTAAGFTP